jgi:hypothetical protein
MARSQVKAYDDDDEKRTCSDSRIIATGREDAGAAGRSISSSFIANSTLAAILPSCLSLFTQPQTWNPRTNFQFHDRLFHGIGRLVPGNKLSDTAALEATVAYCGYPIRVKMRNARKESMVSGLPR